MVIGGIGGTGLSDDVELVSLNSTSQPLPECLTELNSIPIPLSGHAGGLDYSGESGDVEFIYSLPLKDSFLYREWH